MKMNVTSSCVARSCVCRLNTRVPTYTFTPLWFSTGGMGALCVYRACIVRIQIVRVQTVSTLTDSGMCLDIQSTVFGRMYICAYVCLCVYMHVCACVRWWRRMDRHNQRYTSHPTAPACNGSYVTRARHASERVYVYVYVCHMSHARIMSLHVIDLVTFVCFNVCTL